MCVDACAAVGGLQARLLAAPAAFACGDLNRSPSHSWGGPLEHRCGLLRVDARQHGLKALEGCGIGGWAKRGEECPGGGESNETKRGGGPRADENAGSTSGFAQQSGTREPPPEERCFSEPAAASRGPHSRRAPAVTPAEAVGGEGPLIQQTSGDSRSQIPPMGGGRKNSDCRDTDDGPLMVVARVSSI